MSDKKTPKNRDSPFLQEAYGLKTHADNQRFYRKWADRYDALVSQGLAYVAPKKTAARLIHQLPDRTAPILDIGCGTGLASVLLADSGYQTIDGLDCSAEMLEKARERGIYRRLIAADLHQPLALEDASYVAALSSGTFTHGHVGAEPLEEIFRILQPGGYLVCTVHSEIWQEHGFDATINALQQAGRIVVIDITPDRYFTASDPDGIYCVLQKSHADGRRQQPHR